MQPGAIIEHQPRPLKFLIVTASDRASAGEYEDRGGPAVGAALNDFLTGKRWHPEIRKNHRR